VRRQPVLRGFIAAKFLLTRCKRAREFRHRFWSGYELFFHTATVNRLAIAGPQPVDQFRTGAVLFVIAVARCEWLLLDRVNERAVLFERAGDQEEPLAREATQRRRVVHFHPHSQT